MVAAVAGGAPLAHWILQIVARQNDAEIAQDTSGQLLKSPQVDH